MRRRLQTMFAYDGLKKVANMTFAAFTGRRSWQTTAHHIFGNGRMRLLSTAMNRVGGTWLMRKVFGGLGSILMFHRFCEPDVNPINPSMYVTTRFLEDVLLFFKNSDYDVLALDGLIERLLRPGDRRFVVFTIDDGYLDTLTHALPIFRAHGVPFTVFVTAGFLDRRGVYWWGALERLLRNSSEIAFEAPSGPVRLTCATLQQRRRAYETLAQLVESDMVRGLNALERILNAYRVTYEEALDEDMLDRKRLLQLAADPLVNIGAHTVSHRPLASLDDGETWAELVESKRDLEEHIGRSVNHLAYPFGKSATCGDREAALAERAGFRLAVTAIPGNVFSEHRNMPYRLPRLELNSKNEYRDFLELQLSGGLSILRTALARSRA